MPFQKGYIPWNKGKPGHNKGKKFGPNPAHSARMKGKIPWNKGLKGWTIGTKAGYQKGHRDFVPPEARKRQSEKLKGRPLSQEHKNKLWKGGYQNKLMHNKNRRAMHLKALGSHTLSEWESLKAQYNWKCPACNRREPEVKLTEDHIIPLIKGGSHNIENIQPLCKSCNSRKSDRVIPKYEIVR